MELDELWDITESKVLVEGTVGRDELWDITESKVLVEGQWDVMNCGT